MKLFLIDAIGPFFRGSSERRINWSKIPFARLNLAEEARRDQFDQIGRDLRVFAAKARAVGYNAATLDDVAHLADHPWYEPEVRAHIRILRGEFRGLFRIVRDEGMAVYLTMDVLSYTPALKARIGKDQGAINRFLCELLAGLLADFPEISGVIVRIGESDGRDVKDLFRSELSIRTPEQLNRMLHALLPVFERAGRRLILRTWTVGAYPVGDCIWRRDTLERILDRIDSPAFVLSMKHGESDFFRHLPLNPQFFAARFQKIRKIIELQARREYEGCGEYPAFIGADYEDYARQLRQADNMLGVSVWCQTGGWAPFRRLTYLDAAAVWNEINAFVALHVFRHGCTAQEAVRRYCRMEDVAEAEGLWLLLQRSETVVKDLLYVPEYARQQLFFRRVRIPPLLSVYWDTIFINHSMRKIMRHFVRDPDECLRQGRAALDMIEQMRDLARQTSTPAADIDYMRDTFAMLAMAREYSLLPFTEELRQRLKVAKKEYKLHYPSGSRYRYKIKLSFRPFRLRRRYLGWLLALFLRRQRGYRLIDHLLTLHLLALTYRLLRSSHPRLIPKFARKRAMGLDSIFK
jgi:hypothetical protein